MNLPDKQIKNYLGFMLKEFEHINSSSRRAVLVSIRTYAVGLIRVIDFCLNYKNSSLNIDALQDSERGNFKLISRSQGTEREIIHAQNLETTALEGFFCELQTCGKSLKGMRKGTKFCSKQCSNAARKL